MISLVFVSVLLFVDESPLYETFGQNRPGLSFTIIVVTTFTVHNYYRNVQRNQLERPKQIKRIKSEHLIVNDRIPARERLEEVNRLLQTLDNKWISSAFLNVFVLREFDQFLHSSLIKCYMGHDRH